MPKLRIILMRTQSVQDMARLRSQFAVLLSICYLWALSFPLAAECPCRGERSVASESADSAEAPDCCSPDEAPACCSMKPVAPDRADSAPASPAGCCAVAADCTDCPVCLTSGLAMLANESPRGFLLPETAASGTLLVAGYGAAERPSPIDRPPRHAVFPVHISTTVLRC